MKEHPLNKRQEQFIVKAYERFIEERVRGYLDTSGTRHDPIDLKIAETLWKQRLPEFRQCVFDPEVIQKFALGVDEPIPAKWQKLYKHKSSRPVKPVKRPTTLADGRRHRPIERKANESKKRK